MLEESNFNFRYSKRKITKLFTNSGDPDQMPCSAASDLGYVLFANYIFWGLQTKMG